MFKSSDTSAHQPFASANRKSEWDLGKVEQVTPEQQLDAARFIAETAAAQDIPIDLVRDLFEMMELDRTVVAEARNASLVSA